ncbi:hypothetical protein PYCC9005_004986 [Savitreella phatthalungensis]
MSASSTGDAQALSPAAHGLLHRRLPTQQERIRPRAGDFSLEAVPEDATEEERKRRLGAYLRVLLLLHFDLSRTVPGHSGDQPVTYFKLAMSQLFPGLAEDSMSYRSLMLYGTSQVRDWTFEVAESYRQWLADAGEAVNGEWIEALEEEDDSDDENDDDDEDLHQRSALDRVLIQRVDQVIFEDFWKFAAALIDFEASLERRNVRRFFKYHWICLAGAVFFEIKDLVESDTRDHEDLTEQFRKLAYDTGAPRISIEDLVMYPAKQAAINSSVEFDQRCKRIARRLFGSRRNLLSRID